MSETKQDQQAQVVFYPVSCGSAQWHFRRFPTSAFSCDPTSFPDLVDHDAKICPAENDSPDWVPDESACPWCMYARRVYLEPGLKNPPDEFWQYATPDMPTVWCGFVINGSSTWRPLAGAKIRRAPAVPPLFGAVAPPVPTIRKLALIVVESDRGDPAIEVELRGPRSSVLGGFALTEREAESLRQQLNQRLVNHVVSPKLMGVLDDLFAPPPIKTIPTADELQAKMRALYAAVDEVRAADPNQRPAAPAAHAATAIAARIWCPQCKQLHVDRGEWATRQHSTHLCEFCGALWRTPTVGIEAGSTKLYQIDDGGGHHWVAAHSADRAKQVFVDSVGEEPEEWKDDPPTISEVSREVMAKLEYTFEDGSKTAMSNVFDLLNGDECIVATTER